jgi:T5SS/PEP-CTERM-associated repeat protein/autotransporter-associated beta strand protein
MKPSPTPTPPLPATVPQKPRLPLRPAIATAFLLLGLASPLQAAITWTGDISPADPTTWTYNTYGYIGNTSTGTIIVDGASVLQSFCGYIGYNSGSSGTVTVTDAGSQWTTSANLYLGISDASTLTVKDGGTVVVVGAIYASLNNLLGNGTISANSGAVLDADLVFDAANGLPLSLTFGSGGTLNIYRTATLGVGYKGNGSLRITDGVTVFSPGYSYLGYFPGSYGVATVAGAESKWSNIYHLSVGYEGVGTLDIEAGGLVSIFNDGSCVLGDNSGSFGTVKVSGIGSSLTYNSLFIGYSGTGALNIQAGGQVIGDPTDLNGPERTYSFSFIGYNSGSAGTVTVTGTGSKWTPNSDYLYVGYKGSGILKIEAGGEVSSNHCILGQFQDSTGSVTVTGNGSIWTNTSSLSVGNYKSSGSLNIEEGGLVRCSSSCFIGCYRDSIGTVSVAGAGSGLISSGGLVIGYSGNGTLNIGNGIASGGLVSPLGLGLASERTGTAICNLNGGTLQVMMISKGTGTATFNWNDGTIRNNNSPYSLTIDGKNNLVLKLAATGTHAFYIDAGRKGTVSAILSDATSGGTLEKQGDGLLVLSAANTYSGTTTIEGGQLKLVAGGDIAFSSEIINRAGFLIDGGNHSVKKITGSGTTQVLSGSLTAASIVQDTLTIGTNTVPEPATIVLLAVATLAALAWRRKSRVGQA